MADQNISPGSGEFSSRLRSEIDRLGITQSALARALAISTQALHPWLNGTREPNCTNFRRLCVLLRVDANWLVGLSDERADLPDSAAARRALEDLEAERAERLALPDEINRAISRLDQAAREADPEDPAEP